MDRDTGKYMAAGGILGGAAMAVGGGVAVAEFFAAEAALAVATGGLSLVIQGAAILLPYVAGSVVAGAGLGWCTKKFGEE